MSVTKISELTDIGTPASTDVLAIVDTSAGTTKKVSISSLPDTDTTYSNFVGDDGVDDDPANEAAGLVPAPAHGDATAGKYLKSDGTWATPPDTDTNTQLTNEQVQDIVGGMLTGNTETNITVTYQDTDGTIDFVSTDTDTTYSTATTTTAGLVKIEDGTEQSTAANTVTTTASRTYGIQLNASDQAVVNVPWTDTNTVYSHPTGDGNLHVPATGTTNNEKVLTAGATAGSLSWATPSGGGATGGGTDEVFYENGQTVTTNYTLTTNTNAMSAGDITINSGVTVTVPSGSNWVIV